MELWQADQDHVVGLCVSADVPESELVIVSLPVGEKIDDLEAVRLALHDREAHVSVCDVLEGLVGLRQDSRIGLGVSDDVDLTWCEHGPFVEGVPVLIAAWERVAVGDVGPSVVVEVDGVAGRVVNLHVAVLGSGLHPVLGDEQVAGSRAAIRSWLGVLTRAVVVGSIRVKVARALVVAASYFVLVADAILIRIRGTVTCAVKPLFRVHT